MNEEEMANATARLACIAAAQAVEVALSVQMAGLHLIVKKLVEAGALTLDQAAEINVEIADVVDTPDPAAHAAGKLRTDAPHQCVVRP